MSIDKEVKLILKTIEREIPIEIPPEYAEDPYLSVLYSISIAINELNTLLKERFGDHREYLFDENTVVKGDPKSYFILETLGRTSKSGFIINDGSETIYIRVNDGEKIPLYAGETFKWGDTDVRLVVEKVSLETNSTTDQKFRILAV